MARFLVSCCLVSFLTVSLSTALPSFTVETPAEGEVPQITGKLYDGQPPPPSPPRTLPPMQVLDGVEYVIPSEERTITVERVKVEAPVVTDVVTATPAPVMVPTKSVAELWEEWKLAHPGEAFHTLGFSVTVYDHTASRVRWVHEGEQYVAWSNIDWNHMTGFGGITSAAGKIRYTLYLAVGNQTTADVDEPGETKANPAPAIPTLPAGQPGFVIEQGDPSDAQALAGMIALHKLYAARSADLKAAYELRIRHQAERAAWLKENPPKKPDVTVRFGMKTGAAASSEGVSQR